MLNLINPAREVDDIDMGPSVELPLSAIEVNYLGYRVIAPLPVYQCIRCYAVLPHKFNIADKTLRIAICQEHKETKDDHTPQ